MSGAPSSDLIARFRGDLEALAGTAHGRHGIAVSGGPDSLALLLLAHAACPGRIAAATVDHRLRSESAAEAVFVGEICAGLGVPHSILAAEEAIIGNVQAGARDLRYRLLGQWAAAEGIAALLTAHHADDQAETLIMRLGRGAGLGGLAGIRAATTIAGTRVLRPLLGWSRAELALIVAKAGLSPVDDPSNADPRYDRARLRVALAGASWLDPASFARSAGALAEADAALDWAAARLIEERVEHVDGGILFDPEDIPPELRRRILIRILGATGPPRGADLQRLLALLAAGETATLAGIRAEGGQRWRFTPAPPRRVR
jgi:tRNA(Ile)-lysidine synthase